MVLAYTTPKGWSTSAMIAYAAVTNILLMTHLFGEQHALRGAGRRDDGRRQERASLNSYRFVAVNLAQFIVGGFTLPLGGEIRRALWPRRNRRKATGWQITMGIWAVLCVVLF